MGGQHDGEKINRNLFVKSNYLLRSVCSYIQVVCEYISDDLKGYKKINEIV